MQHSSTFERVTVLDLPKNRIPLRHRPLMKKGILFFLLMPSLTASAQNECAAAVAITAGTHVVAAVNGSGVPNPDCFGVSPDVQFGEWYTYTPATNLGLKVTSDLPINFDLDPRFHIYTGVCGALICVGGDDDSGSGYLAVDSLNVTAGVTYTIAWDDRWSESGFTFALIEMPVFVLPFGFTNAPQPTQGRVLAALDMTNDGLDDIVTIDSTRIIVHAQVPGGFNTTTYTTTEADHDPSWSLCAGDLDGNGQNDLLYGGGQGVTIMMASTDGTGFTELVYPQYVFSQRSNMVDINNDGDLDAFVCHDVDPNVFYMNDGNGNFVFNQGGLGDTPDGGNYGSIWVDYDNDRDLDLFLAKCRGGASQAAIDQMYRNNGDGTFTEVAESLNLANGFHQSWSGAWGDLDRDGDMDVLVGASSNAFGSHKLMRNDGSTFTEVTAGSGFDTFTGLSTEWTTHDFNNDGWLDILGGGAIMLGTGDLTFAFGVSVGSQAIGDMNNDGFLDILGSNLVRMNNTNLNNWLKVRLEGTVSNRNAIGARVMVTTALGTQIREIRSGDGFRYMSTLTAHFGLGADTEIEEVRILWPSGLETSLTDVAVNTTVDVVESITTAVPTEVPGQALFRVYPNPAEDLLYLDIGAPVSGPITILDVTGKTIPVTLLANNQIDIRSLASGLYALRVLHNNTLLQTQFVKH